MAHTHGRFVWYELMTTDMEAAEIFYRDVVGWGAQDAGMSGVRYTMFTVGSRPVSGSMALPQSARSMGIPPLWLGYIAVDDVDTLAADIVIDGGVVHRAAADIPGIGRFAIVGDPQGAAFALYHGAAGEPPSSAVPDTPGHIGWHELYAEDGDAAFDFYSRTFGWSEIRTVEMDGMGAYRIFGLGDNDIGGMTTKPENMPVPSWIFYFNVPEIDAARDRVKAGGGMILNGPKEVPGGWTIQCLDPQGAMFALFAPER